MENITKYISDRIKTIVLLKYQTSYKWLICALIRFIFLILIIGLPVNCFGSARLKIENIAVRLALFSNLETISDHSLSIDTFLKGFLESLGKAGFDLNHNVEFETFITTGPGNTNHAQSIKQIRSGKFDFILCMGNSQAEFLVDEGFPQRKIIVIDEVVTDIKSHDEGGLIRVSTGLNLTRKFALLHAMFPHIDRVIYILDEGSKNSALRLRELEDHKMSLHIKDVIPVYFNEQTNASRCLDTISPEKSLIFLSGDLKAGESAVSLTAKATELGIPVIAHSAGLVSSGALLSVTSDLIQTGREAGELAVESVLRVKSMARRHIQPHSEHLTLNIQCLEKLFAGKSNNFARQLKVNNGFSNAPRSETEIIEQITTTAHEVFGKNIALLGKYVSLGNNEWKIDATGVSISKVAKELNSVLRLSGKQGRLVLNGDTSLLLTLRAREKNLKDLIDKAMIGCGGICNLNNQDEYLCYLPQSSPQPEEQLTWIYRPHGADPGTIRQKTEKLNFGVSTDQADESNTLIFRGPLSSLVRLRDHLLTFDIIPPEVLIELLVVEFIHGDSFSWGIDIGSGQKNSISKAVFSPGSLNPVNLTFNVLDSLSLNFNANIKALSENSEARIVTNPHLATKNGKPASISSKEQRFIQLESYDYVSTRTAHMLQQLDAGVELKITPWIMAGNNIDLHLEGNLSVFELPSTETNAEHVVNATRIESSVSVKDGATLIIGGLIKSENSRSRYKVPGLGSIPILGTLFSRIHNRKIIIETVIYVTPHIYPLDTYDTISSWTEVEHLLQNLRTDINKSIRIMNRTR